MSTTNIITLTTDFGLKDPYVGQLKGAILKRNSEARIIDITHAVPPQDIVTAAITLQTSFHYFPKNTIHMVVVDPGVGSQRAILAAEGDAHLFIVPDNGILSPLLAAGSITSLYRIENSDLYPSEVSGTFHGRDIMAPVAAALAGGLKLSQVGPEVDLDSCIMLNIAKPVIQDDSIEGQVLGIDHFGNIRTNITAACISRFQPECFAGIALRGQIITTITTTYSQCPEGDFTGIIDSSGYLEIAVNKGNASERIGTLAGDPVTVLMDNSIAIPKAPDG